MEKTLTKSNPVRSLIEELPGEVKPRADSYTSYQLTDVIDIENLQSIQDAFAYALDVGSVIVDLKDNLITRPSNFSEVCELIQSTEKGRERCKISNNQRNAKSRNQSKPIYHRCLSCGFVDGCAPIFLGDTHVADWLVGQVNVLGVNKETIAEYAREIGVDEQRMLEAFDQMPSNTVEKYERILELHFAIAQELSKLGLNNLRLKKEITAREEVTRQLKKSERHLKEFFSSAMEGICISDKNNNIIYANPAILDLFGLKSMEKVIGRNVFEFFQNDQHDILKDQLRNRAEGKSSKYEVSLINRYGKKLHLLISAVPRLDDNNNHIGSFTSIIDITEQKRLQEYISRAERLETAGRIAAQVAHDFNNLLGPLVAYPEIIKKHLPQNSADMKLLEDIDRAANMMAEINQQLLTLGRRGHYNLEDIDINELLRQSLENIKSELTNVNVALDLSKEIMSVKGGGSQLIRVFTNLLYNSLDAMESSGKLSIKTENYYADHKSLTCYRVPQGEYIKVTITDTGCGIDPESIPLIFDPFYTTKKTDIKRGSGLGLSVVHSVIEDHNGYINIKSEPGKGTSVYIYLPLSREVSEIPECENPSGSNEKILVVDDDPVQRSVASNMLTDLGYKVSVCNSGEEAVDVLRDEDFDLVMLDMIMPDGMDGTSTYEAVLKFKPSQKAILVSGYADSQRVEKARRLGISAFIAKPLRARNTGRAIKEVLS